MAFSFGSAAAPATGPPPAAPPAPSATVPPPAPAVPYEAKPLSDLFPSREALSDIRAALTGSASPADLGSLLSLSSPAPPGSHGKSLLSPPTPSLPSEKDSAALASAPSIVLPSKDTVPLPANVKTAILELSDDLNISVDHALALWVHASNPDNRKRIAVDVSAWYEVAEARRSYENVKAARRHRAREDRDRRSGHLSKKRAMPVPLPPKPLPDSVPVAARAIYAEAISAPLDALRELLICRSSPPLDSPLLPATGAIISAGLVDNLLNIVRESNRVIADDVKAYSVKTPNQPQNHATPPKSSVFHAVESRQRALVALFYLFYSTQAKASEVADLIDVVRELSDGLRLSPPAEDLPTPNDGLPAPSTEERKNFQALRLRATHQTTLLQALSTALLALFASLSQSTVFLDRETSEPNPFGQGNALLPPPSSYTADNQNRRDIKSGLDLIHSRLFSHHRSTQFTHAPTHGLCLVAFASLLHPSVHARSPPAMKVDARAVHADCLRSACPTKAFTFARLSLLSSFSPMPPSTQRNGPVPSPSDPNFEFYSTVLADFVHSYALAARQSGEAPLSVAQYKKDRVYELEMQAMHSQQQHQMRSWQPGLAADAAPPALDIDAEVKKAMQSRPDCADDVLALAAAVVAGCPPAACRFWNYDYSPPRPGIVLSDFHLSQADDPNLLPAYLNLLSALALCPPTQSTEADDSGAAAVHGMLADPTSSSALVVVQSPTASPGPSQAASNLSWKFLLSTFQGYADLLKPAAVKVNPQASMFGVPGSMPVSRTSPVRPARQPSMYSALNGYGDPTSSFSNSSDVSSSAPKKDADAGPPELGEMNAAALMSVLQLLFHVTSQSKPAASEILRLSLSNNADVIASLFSLLGCAIEAPLKGLILKALSALVDGAPEPAVANRTWELLEASQIMPTLASNNLNTSESSPSNLGIFHEMTMVEKPQGRYLITEGLCCLIASLVKAVGTPVNLGGSWRRPGAGPYIDFILDHVVPTAICDPDKMKFKSGADRWRLAARGLEVLSITLARYVVPRLASNDVKILAKDVDEATRVGQKLEGIFIPTTGEASSEDERTEFARDFKDEWIRISVAGNAGALVAPAVSTALVPTVMASQQATLTAPRPKTPAFTIMSSVLSGRPLLSAIMQTIGGVDELENEFNTVKTRLLSSAMFLETPSEWLANAEVDVVELSSGVTAAVSTKDAGFWMERSVTMCLRLLAAVAAREKSFAKAVTTSSTALEILPVLQGRIYWGEDDTGDNAKIDKEKEHGGDAMMTDVPSALPHVQSTSILPKRKTSVSVTGGMDVWAVSVTPITHVLTSIRNTSAMLDPVSLIGGYIKYCEGWDEEISSRSVGIVRHVVSRIAPSQLQRIVFGGAGDGHLPEAFAIRLLKDDEDVTEGDDGVRMAILDLIIENLVGPPPTLSHHMLGLVNGASLERTNCLDAVIELLSEPSGRFLADPRTASLASRCYELLYKIVRGKDNVGTFVRNRLRKDNFWLIHIGRFLACDEKNLLRMASLKVNSSTEADTASNATIHGLAWLMKGVAVEIFSCYSTNERSSCSKLMSMLFGGAGVPNSNRITAILASLTIRAPGGGRPIAPPPELASAAIAKSTVVQKGDADVFDNFRIIDCNKVGKALSENASLKTMSLDWAKDWNRYVTAACAASHACRAWGTIVDVSVGGCRDVLVDDDVMDINGLSLLLHFILEKLVGGRGVAKAALEASSALPLCVSLLNIIWALKASGSSISSSILSLVSNAIVVCGRGEGGEDLSGVLSCALCMCIDGAEAKGSLRADVNAALVKAAGFLVGAGGGGRAGNNGRFARSAFCSVLSLTADGGEGIVDVLHRDMSSQCLKSLIALGVGDREGIWTLVEIACSHSGAKNLLDGGVGSALIATCGMGEEINEESSFRGAAWSKRDGYATVGLDEEDRKGLLFGQLQLMSTMLCRLPKSGLLMNECSRFLRLRCNTGVDMLRDFPKDIDIVEAYVNVLEMVGAGGGWGGVMGKVGGKIEQGVLSLGLHLCNFPMRDGAGVGGRRQEAPSWWDAVKLDAATSEERGMPMTGLSGGRDNRATWCELDYEYIDSAMRIAVACIGFVRNRVTYEEGRVMVIDGSYLAKGLEICVRLGRVLEGKRMAMVSEHNLDEDRLEELVEKVRSSDGMGQIDAGEWRVMVEVRWVVSLEKRVGRLCENLLVLCALQLGVLEKIWRTSGIAQNGRKAWDEMGKVVMKTLNVCDLEGRGISGEKDTSFTKKLARTIREKCEGVKQ